MAEFVTPQESALLTNDFLKTLFLRRKVSPEHKTTILENVVRKSIDKKNYVYLVNSITKRVKYKRFKVFLNVNKF